MEVNNYTEKQIKDLKKTIWRLAFPINDWIKLAIRIITVLTIYSFKKSVLWIFLGYLFPIISLIYMLITGEFKGFTLDGLINFYF